MNQTQTTQPAKQRRSMVQRTHCLRGHEYNNENTIYTEDPRAKTGIRRQCRICKRETARVWRKMQ